jgi:hypothetical protein
MNSSSIIALLLVFTSFSCNEHPTQYTEPSEYAYEVLSFFEKVYNYNTYYNDSLGWQRDFSFSEIENLSSQYYNVIYSHYVDYYYYHIDLFHKWEDLVRANNYVIVDPSPGVKLSRIRDKIAEFYSPEFARILQYPYFLRIKTLDFKDTFYIGTDSTYFSQTDMMVLIEDVIKGENRFTANDTMTISFLDGWFFWAQRHFEEGKNYFIPIRPWRIEDKKIYSYAVYPLDEIDVGVYPIENEVVHTYGNYFKLGDGIPWNTFRDKFIKKFVIN